MAQSPLIRTLLYRSTGYVSTVAIAAAIIAAVRLAKVEDLDLSISKVMTTVQQSVRLARTILDEALRR